MGNRQWLFPYIGAYWSYRKGDTDEKNLFGQRIRNDRQLAATIGVRYTMPWLVVLDSRIDTYGRVRLQLERENIPLTSRLRMNLMVNTEAEYSVGLHYIILPYLSVTANYNSDLKSGAGLQCTF